MKFTHSTVMRIIEPGHVEQVRLRTCRRSPRRPRACLPHDVCGGCTPKPRNDSVDSVMIAAATAERRVHHDRADDVRQDVAHDDPRRRRARRARGLDELLLLERRAPGRGRRARSYIQNRQAQHQDDDGVGLARATSARRRGSRCSGTTRNRSVSRISTWSAPAPEVAGDRTDRSVPSDRRDDRDREADLQRDLAGVEDPAQLVAAELVGAEPVRAVGRRPGRASRSWWFVVERARSQLAAEAQNDDEDQQQERDRPRRGGGRSGGGTAATASCGSGSASLSSPSSRSARRQRPAMPGRRQLAALIGLRDRVSVM